MGRKERKNPSKTSRRNGKYPRKISRRILILCALLITVLCSAITFLSYKEYKANIYARYYTYLEAILKLAVEDADAEGIQEAIQNQTQNEAYQNLSRQFNKYMEHTDIMYIYALYFKEQDENMYYVLNGYKKETEQEMPEEIHRLGDMALEVDWDLALVKDFQTAFLNGSNEIQKEIGDNKKHELLMTAYFPLYDDKGNPVCIIGVDANMYDIMNKLNGFTGAMAGGVVVFGILFLTALFFLLRLGIINPVKRLAESAYCFITEQEKKSPEELVFNSAGIHSKDEIQLLSDSIECMVAQIQNYIGNIKSFTAEQERVNAQFGIVQQLKENLFPFQFPAFQDRTDFGIDAKIRFSKGRSGDFYDFFLIDPKHICFFAGTASGNGVTTTMVAMITTIYMENYARLGYQPNRIVSETNNRISENNSGEITVNAFLGIVNLDNGEFTYVQVGEIAPIIKKSGQEAKVLECSTGFPLGSIENVMYVQQKMYFSQGESILVYTKGVSERTDQKKYEYGEERVLQQWNMQIHANYELSEMTAQMQADIENFAKGTVQEADETMLVFRYTGK